MFKFTYLNLLNLFYLNLLLFIKFMFKFTYLNLNLFDQIFMQGNVFLVITGNETREQGDRNNTISPK